MINMGHHGHHGPSWPSRFPAGSRSQASLVRLSRFHVSGSLGPNQHRACRGGNPRDTLEPEGITLRLWCVTSCHIWICSRLLVTYLDYHSKSIWKFRWQPARRWKQNKHGLQRRTESRPSRLGKWQSASTTSANSQTTTRNKAPKWSTPTQWMRRHENKRCCQKNQDISGPIWWCWWMLMVDCDCRNQWLGPAWDSETAFWQHRHVAGISVPQAQQLTQAMRLPGNVWMVRGFRWLQESWGSTMVHLNQQRVSWASVGPNDKGPIKESYDETSKLRWVVGSFQAYSPIRHEFCGWFLRYLSSMKLVHKPA